MGEGSPTVILESGDESGIEEWGLIRLDLSEVTRTCAYDRGGIGRSDPVTGCRQLDDLIADLEQQVVVDSGHDVATNEPELVVAEVVEVVRAAQ